ncbi:hypothetical protein ACFYVL_39985 [Streptomyces sp. NPDC004111]|uniref:hypothetical protein n=1 Tax=Streptomyces sp. NPDC004111 TaxID=3364690 RepID=UPI0036BDD413
MTVQTVEIVAPEGDECHKVWVVVDGEVRLADSRPLPAKRFGNGHFWMFDGGASDLDDPYSCGLCGEAKWKSYKVPCANGRTPEDLNAERAQWIAEHLYDGEPVWEVRNGFRHPVKPVLVRRVHSGGAREA